MASSVNERELILDTLLQITREGEYCHIALRNVLEKYQYLDKKQRAFITRVINGTLEHLIEIDYMINQFSKVKVNKMKPVICAIIRSGVYQLKYMDSVPDSAVCNEAVKLAEKRGFSSLKAFVNGVLRNVSRNINKIGYPKDYIEHMSVRYSMPKWILEQWLERYGEDNVLVMAEDFMKEKPVTIRFNPDRISREELEQMLREEGVRTEEIPEFPAALHLYGYNYLGGLESFRKGYYHVQDINSMRTVHWAAPQKGDTVIDVCAAPGGKALHMAERLHGTGHVEARDLTGYKVSLLVDNIERSGLKNIEAVKWDATVLDRSAVGSADIVIADLPCSGLGVIGKKPDLKYKMTEEMQKELAELQRKMLSVVQNYVKPGGKLVYSTCTVSWTENEGNARWFKEAYPAFSLVREKQMIPGLDEGDGFYIALFQKENHG